MAQYCDVHFDHNGTFLRIDTCEATRDLRDYSHYIFRGSKRHNITRNAVLTAVSAHGRVLNIEADNLNFGLYNKMVKLVRLSDAGLPLIATRRACNQDQFNSYIEETIENAPSALLKPVSGGLGEVIQLAHGPMAADPDMDPRATMVLDYMPIEHDYRVLVLGNKSLGVMRRSIPDGLVVRNVEQGGIVSAATLSDEICEMALKAARVMGLEFTGVDILMQDQTSCILEVNAITDFKGFEEATDQNVAEAMLSYLLSTSGKPEQPLFAQAMTAAPKPPSFQGL